LWIEYFAAMDQQTVIIACGLFLAVAFLYSSVGHAGASGYLAVMALLSFPIASIKPTSLVLNIVVSIIASYKFIKEGYFNKKVFISFAITSIPFAFLGGYIKVDPGLFKIFAGIFLLVSAALLLIKEYVRPASDIRPVNYFLSASVGAVIGLVSGLIGVGGGIFLSPLIILLGYTKVKEASGVAALFILCNSVLGLLGHYVSLKSLDSMIIFWVLTVAIGGFIGAHLGARKFTSKLIIAFLFLVLISAGLKFILVG
jgi:uncharacterized protein